MITCRDVTERLLDLELGELPEDEARAVRAHQAACPRCAAFAHGYAAVPALVREALESAITPELQARLDAAVREALRDAG